MKIRVLKLLIVVISIKLLFSCKQKEENKIPVIFKTFVFSSAGLYFDYSIKLNLSDTIYLEERFPNPKKSFCRILKKGEKDTLFQFLQKINFSNYNSEYIDNHLSDGTAYRFIIKKESSIDSVFIYGNKAPKVFFELAKIMKNMKNRVPLTLLKNEIDFENLNYKMFPPPPPPRYDVIHFKTAAAEKKYKTQ